MRDATFVLLAPGPVFRRVAEAGRYGWALAAMILLTTMVGWATVQTGLIDQQVDRQTRKAEADLEREQADLLTRLELSAEMENIRKTAAFTKLMARGGAILLAPLLLIASLMLTAAALFAVVALAGNKPDYAILMSICVYSAAAIVAGSLVRLGMMLAYRTMSVDTSLAMFVPRTEENLQARMALSAIDFFSIWFWVLVGLGLVVTGQLSRKAAVIACLILGLVATAAKLAPAMAAMAGGAA